MYQKIDLEMKMERKKQTYRRPGLYTLDELKSYTKDDRYEDLVGTSANEGTSHHAFFKVRLRSSPAELGTLGSGASELGGSLRSTKLGGGEFWEWSPRAPKISAALRLLRLPTNTATANLCEHDQAPRKL